MDKLLSNFLGYSLKCKFLFFKKSIWLCFFFYINIINVNTLKVQEKGKVFNRQSCKVY